MNFEKLGYHSLTLGLEFIMDYCDELLKQPVIEVSDLEAIKGFMRITLRDITKLEKIVEEQSMF